MSVIVLEYYNAAHYQMRIVIFIVHFIYAQPIDQVSRFTVNVAVSVVVRLQ